MSKRPHHTKKDTNQLPIVRRLRDLGLLAIEVADLPGSDDPAIGHPLDLFVCGLHIRRDRFEWLQVEIKQPGGQLDAKERAYFDYWPEIPRLKAVCVQDILRWYGRCE